MTDARITDDEWQQLSPENFETVTLLDAVGAIDDLRDHLNDGDYGAPPQLRTDLLRLHQVAMEVINQGSRSQVAKLFDRAMEIEDQVFDMMRSLENVQETLAQLTALYPSSLSDAAIDFDDILDEDTAAS